MTSQLKSLKLGSLAVCEMTNHHGMRIAPRRVLGVIRGIARAKADTMYQVEILYPKQLNGEKEMFAARWVILLELDKIQNQRYTKK